MEKSKAKTAKPLAPVSKKSQEYYSTEGKTLADIMQKANQCLDDIENEESLNILLQIRKEIAARIEPFTSLIETIESNIKKADLDAGEYGFIAQLVISYAKTTTIDEPEVFKIIKNKGLNPLDYAKLQTSNSFVKEIIKNNPGVATVDLYGTKRHSFK